MNFNGATNPDNRVFTRLTGRALLFSGGSYDTDCRDRFRRNDTVSIEAERNRKVLACARAWRINTEEVTMNIREELEKFRDGLMQQRDELRVQLNLAKLEAEEEWKKTEEKLEEFKSKLAGIADEAKDASEDVWTSVKMLGEEIKSAYERIKSRI
jgi:SMC interacting uncharacterized protein involved in chromosome segregation